MSSVDYIRTIRQKIGHDYLLMPGVVALIFNDANEILLGRRTDTGRWAVIGGAVDLNETPAVAIKREAMEEVGVEIEIERVVGIYITPPIEYPNGDVTQYVSTSFRCRIVRGTPHVADHESSAVQFFPLDQLPPDLTAEHRRRIADAAEPGTHQSAEFE